VKKAGQQLQPTGEYALFRASVLLAFDGRYRLYALTAAGIAPCFGQCQGGQHPFNFSAAMKAAGFQVKAMRFEFFETGLNVPALPVEGQCRRAVKSLVMAEYQQFSGSGAGGANAHGRFERASYAKVHDFADAENQEVVFVSATHLTTGAVNSKHQRLTGRFFHKAHEHSGDSIEIRAYFPGEILEAMEFRFSQRLSRQSFDNVVKQDGLGFDGG
jgi:hypothetical protein